MAEETTNLTTEADATALAGAEAPVVEQEAAVTQVDTPDAAQEAQVEVKAPEKYELALEGVDLDAETLAAADPIFRELNLSNDEAAKLLPVAKNFADKIGKTIIDDLVAKGAQQRKTWLDEAKADEHVGGAKWDESLHLAAKGFDALGMKAGHPFRVALEETGFGNNADMIRIMRSLGELVGEDGGFVRADVAEKKSEPLKALYPND